MFLCPICREPLSPGKGALACPKGHSFDMAAQGYVNLLPPNRKKSKEPGDNGEMLAARTRFLQTGAYQPLSDALNELLLSACGTDCTVLDAGCGEGYYAARLLSAFQEAGRALTLCGIDISKAAVKTAARHAGGGQGRFAVASVYDVPLPDRSLDAAYSVFAPLCPPELYRLLRGEGAFLLVQAGKRHLYGLKELLYEKPYENPEREERLEGFRLLERKRLTWELHLQGRQQILSLFQMTPYYYKTPAQAAAKLERVEELQTEVDFVISDYRKEAVL